jgi:N-methylhydantoinase B
MNGGYPGAKARVIVNPGTEAEIDLGKIDIYHPEPGDIVTILTPGGGGHGDPLDRMADDVATDVRLGYVSADAAVRDYGVVLGADGRADPARTEALRARLRQERGPRPAFDFGPERRAWEAVFDDAAMIELNALLMRLGTSVRGQRRERLFKRVVPGLAEGKGKALDTLLDNPAEARARLESELDGLRAQVATLNRED